MALVLLGVASIILGMFFAVGFAIVRANRADDAAGLELERATSQSGAVQAGMTARQTRRGLPDVGFVPLHGPASQREDGSDSVPEPLDAYAEVRAKASEAFAQVRSVAERSVQQVDDLLKRFEGRVASPMDETTPRSKAVGPEMPAENPSILRQENGAPQPLSKNKSSSA